MIRYRNNRSDFWFDLINNIVMFIFLVFGIDFIPIDLPQFIRGGFGCMGIKRYSKIKTSGSGIGTPPFTPYSVRSSALY